MPTVDTLARSGFGHDFGEMDVHPDVPKPEQDTATHPGAAVTRLSSFVRKVVAAPGTGHTVSLPLRAPVEAASGVDLSKVRPHTDPRNAAAAQNVGAQAFAYGHDIFFAPGRYEPTTSAGQSLLHHELEHVAARIGGEPPDRGGSGSLAIERYPNQKQAGTAEKYLVIVRSVEASNPGTDPRATLEAVKRLIQGEYGWIDKFRYFETRQYGWIDIVHFTTAANMAASIGEVLVDVLGFGLEVVQWINEWGSDYRSGFSPEDIPSNSAGSNFGDDVFDPAGGPLSAQLEAYLNTLGPIDPNSSATYTGLPVADVHGGSGGILGSNWPAAAGAAAPRMQIRDGSCEPEYLGMGAYLGADCIVRQGTGPKE